MKPSLPSKLKTIYPFDNRWLTTKSNHKIHYVDEGSGHPIIMVHGNPTWSFFYRNLIIGLRSTHRCIAPDHIGCGLSEKPQNYPYLLQNHINNLTTLVERLNLQKFHLIVHDWGGPIGLGMAQKFPEKIGKITILNTAAWPSHQIPKRISLCKKPFLGPFLIRGLNAFAHSATSMAVATPLPPLHIPEQFSQKELKNAITEIQHGKIDYPTFLLKAIQSGIANYTVFLNSSQVHYYSRNGETHIEHFPQK